MEMGKYFPLGSVLKITEMLIPWYKEGFYNVAFFKSCFLVNLYEAAMNCAGKELMNF